MYTEPVIIPKHIEAALSKSATMANKARELKLNAMRKLFARLPHKIGDTAVVVKNGKRKVKVVVADACLRPPDKIKYVFRQGGSLPFRRVHVFDGDTVIWEDKNEQ